MSGLKIEVFLTVPICTNSSALVELLREIQGELGDAVEVVTYEGEDEMAQEYNVTATPAVVVEGIVKLVGFCPSKESLLAALKEMGLE